MGANAVTTVPTYVAGEVLTAVDLNITNSGVPVFATTVTRDAAFGGTGEKTLAQGQLCYIEATDKVQFYNGTAWANLGSVTKVDAFTASGTFTPPTGVTYAIAHILAGGGGLGTSAGQGGTSSVAFAAGTVSATGGLAGLTSTSGVSFKAGAANSGEPATAFYNGVGDANSGMILANKGAYIVAGGTVTPGTGITVTVGNGGTGSATGGSGYVWIEYEV